MAYLVSVGIMFFFLLTPFFVVSMFLTMTRERTEAERRGLAVRVTLAIVAVCAVLYFFGNLIFSLFGITVDAFRVGAGGLLFLTAVSLVRGSDAPAAADAEGDIAVVPLAIPMTVGPATTGALLVMGAQAEDNFQRFAGFGALAAAVVAVGALLFLASSVERLIGRKGITILTKLTGLVLAALAAQMTFAGARNLLNPPPG
ncbi:MAG TPA: MarC family protein [Planctomycetota bacterium]|nr:MarC family protein [Planctomycetota bacterium]